MRVLVENPFEGFTSPHGENPRRPILTQDGYEKLLAAAPTVSPAMATLLVVANETGHRIDSIHLLRWPDVNFEASTIRWRGNHDTIGHEHIGADDGGPAGAASAAEVVLDIRRARGVVVSRCG